MNLKYIMRRWNTPLSKRLPAIFTLVFVVFLSCEDEKVVKEVTVASVENSSLTESEVNEFLGEKSGIAKYRDEYIRQWVENELLYQFAAERELLTDENYHNVLNNSSKELAATIAIREYLTNQKFDYSDNILKKYYQENKDDFAFQEDAYVLNMIAFSDEPAAIAFRNASLDKGWDKAVDLFNGNSALLFIENAKLYKISGIQSKIVSRALKTMFKGEISVVVNSELNNFVIVQQLDKILSNSTPPFKYIADDVRVSYSIVKQRERLKNFIDSLIVRKNVEIF